MLLSSKLLISSKNYQSLSAGIWLIIWIGSFKSSLIYFSLAFLHYFSISMQSSITDCSFPNCFFIYFVKMNTVVFLQSRHFFYAYFIVLHEKHRKLSLSCINQKKSCLHLEASFLLLTSFSSYLQIYWYVFTP